MNSLMGRSLVNGKNDMGVGYLTQRLFFWCGFLSACACLNWLLKEETFS